MENCQENKKFKDNVWKKLEDGKIAQYKQNKNKVYQDAVQKNLERHQGPHN